MSENRENNQENIQIDESKLILLDEVLKENEKKESSFNNLLEEPPEEVERITVEDLRNQDTSKEKEEPKRSIFREIFSTVMYVAVIFLIALFIITFVGQRTVVSGSSMETTLSDGDNLIIDKISYRFTDPDRFDIVVFPDPADPDVYFIKRIIGLPGETIQIDQDGNIYINGEILEENYGREQILSPGIVYEPYTLGEDEYFVLGDNRNNSLDSRFAEVGPISREDLVGRAVLRIYPFSEFTSLIPDEED